MTATTQPPHDRHGAAAPCPVCASAVSGVFIEVSRVPVHCHILRRSREAALRAARGDIRLAHCPRCDHVFNVAFDPARMEYAAEYDNALDFSPRFRRYATSLAERLIARHGIADKAIVEIGCGDGAFLRLLCTLGDNRGVGFDPKRRADAGAVGRDPAIRIIGDRYSARYADVPADLICCRHVLEHISQPQGFLAGVRDTIGDRSRTVIYFEVPNAAFTWRDLGVWDLIYEHCSYFSATSLDHLFRCCGFEAIVINEAYGGQFLCLEARPGPRDGTSSSPAGDAPSLRSEIEGFADRYREKVAFWRLQLEQMTAAGRRAVLWGAGSKAVSFLNVMRRGAEAGADAIACVVDVNPRKCGCFVPGTGHEIVAPEALREVRPDVVIVMNPIYREEIAERVGKLLPDAISSGGLSLKPV